MMVSSGTGVVPSTFPRLLLTRRSLLLIQSIFSHITLIGSFLLQFCWLHPGTCHEDGHYLGESMQPVSLCCLTISHRVLIAIFLTAGAVQILVHGVAWDLFNKDMPVAGNFDFKWSKHDWGQPLVYIKQHPSKSELISKHRSP